MKVYVWKHSGNSYKLRVLLALIGVEYEEVMVNFRTHEHKSADYRKINPRGQVPALVDGEMVLWWRAVAAGGAGADGRGHELGVAGRQRNALRLAVCATRPDARHL